MDLKQRLIRTRARAYHAANIRRRRSAAAIELRFGRRAHRPSQRLGHVSRSQLAVDSATPTGSFLGGSARDLLSRPRHTVLMPSLFPEETIDHPPSGTSSSMTITAGRK